VSWWPFKKKEKKVHDNLHIKGTKFWLQDVEGQRLIRQMQVEWTDSHQKGDVSNELLAGLDRRCFRLLRADSDEWLKWLDDEDFWAPGWGIESTE
jgi:hypothetical protein